MATDPELSKILEAKDRPEKHRHEQRPWGKIWHEVRKRDGIPIRQDNIVVPKSLQAQAIAITHEGHQQSDGTLQMLSQTQWFGNMRKAVREFVESCKCQTANPANPTLPLKFKPLPQAPWKVTAVDYKGPIGTGRNQVYLHTQMDAYSDTQPGKKQIHPTQTAKEEAGKCRNSRMFPSFQSGFPRTLRPDCS